MYPLSTHTHPFTYTPTYVRTYHQKIIFGDETISVHIIHSEDNCSHIRVQGAGYRIQGTRCRVQGAEYRVQGAEYKVQSTGCRVQGAGCRVQGAGCRVQGAGHRTNVSSHWMNRTYKHSTAHQLYRASLPHAAL